MTSKLEYLQRYMTKDGDSASTEKKKRKKKKTTSRKEAGVSNPVNGSLRIVDEDHSWQHDAPTRADLNETWEMDAAEDDAPVVVAEGGEEIDPQDLPVIVNAHEFQGQQQHQLNKKAAEGEELDRTKRKATHAADDRDLSPPRRERAGQGSGMEQTRGRPRQDSSDDSPPRRRNDRSTRTTVLEEDASPPRRRASAVKREATSPADASPPRRPRKRGDVDDDASPPRRSRASAREHSHTAEGATNDDADASPPRRQRVEAPSSSSTAVAAADSRIPSSGDHEALRHSSPSRRHRHRARSRSPSFRGTSRRPRSSSRDRDRRHHRSSSRYTRRRSRSHNRSQSRSPRYRSHHSQSRSHRTHHASDSRTRSARSRSQSPRSRRPRSHSRSRSRNTSESPSRRRSSTAFSRENPRESTLSRINAPQETSTPPVVVAEADAKPKADSVATPAPAPAQTSVEDKYKPRAGLFTASEFADDLKRKTAQKDLMRGAKKEDLGHKAETVYRDRKGRKLDMLNEMVRQQEVLAGKKQREQEDKYEWGTGKVQKEAKLSQQQLLDKMKSAPFARREDDAELDQMRRERVRAFDPMQSKVFQDDALFNGEETSKRSSKSKSKSGKHKDKKNKPKMKTKSGSKPKYAGPPAPPNRFGITPGYRWDGVVRGTAWEEKVMLRQNAQSAMSEEAYKYAVADM